MCLPKICLAWTFLVQSFLELFLKTYSLKNNKIYLKCTASSHAYFRVVTCPF